MSTSYCPTYSPKEIHQDFRELCRFNLMKITGSSIRRTHNSSLSGESHQEPSYLKILFSWLFFFLNVFVCLVVFINVFIYLFDFWLCWVFVSVRGLSPVAGSGGHSSSRCAGLSLSRPLVAEHRLQTRRLSSCCAQA